MEKLNLTPNLRKQEYVRLRALEIALSTIETIWGTSQLISRAQEVENYVLGCEVPSRIDSNE